MAFVSESLKIPFLKTSFESELPIVKVEYQIRGSLSVKQVGKSGAELS